MKKITSGPDSYNKVKVHSESSMVSQTANVFQLESDCVHVQSYLIFPCMHMPTGTLC